MDSLLHSVYEIKHSVTCFKVSYYRFHQAVATGQKVVSLPYPKLSMDTPSAAVSAYIKGSVCCAGETVTKRGMSVDNLGCRGEKRCLICIHSLVRWVWILMYCQNKYFYLVLIGCSQNFVTSVLCSIGRACLTAYTWCSQQVSVQTYILCQNTWTHFVKCQSITLLHAIYYISLTMNFFNYC